MKDVEHEQFIWDGAGRLRLGGSQWEDGAERSVEWAWKDKNGDFSRGSTAELPDHVFAKLVVLAFAHGYLTWPMLASALAELTAPQP